ncbi:hypothetical protein, partial [Accumulibacter sp.]|uniref:hypothetical protein n=1 Tax=Accumulibacter sp. TaxID=2053492 RepID=UPI001A5BF361
MTASACHSLPLAKHETLKALRFSARALKTLKDVEELKQDQGSEGERQRVLRVVRSKPVGKHGQGPDQYAGGEFGVHD